MFRAQSRVFLPEGERSAVAHAYRLAIAKKKVYGSPCQDHRFCTPIRRGHVLPHSGMWRQTWCCDISPAATPEARRRSAIEVGFVIRVAFCNRQKVIMDFQKGIDDVRIEMLVASLPDNVDRFFMRKRWLVDAP